MLVLEGQVHCPTPRVPTTQIGELRVLGCGDGHQEALVSPAPYWVFLYCDFCWPAASLGIYIGGEGPPQMQEQALLAVC